MFSTQNHGEAAAPAFSPAPAPAPIHEADPPMRFRAAALAVAAAGGLLTGAGMMFAAALASGPASQDLQRVASDAIETAAQSLTVGEAATLVANAKACKRPLGFLVVRATGRAGGTMRFRSGGYASPYVRLGIQPERVALPFPAPVEAGHGQIVVENNSDGADLFLVPGFRVPAGSGASVIDVRWNPSGPC